MNRNELVPIAVDCKRIVEDAEAIYNLPGKRYDILEILEDHFIIETEDDGELEISIEDSDFDIVMGKEEDYGNIR